MPRHDVSDRVRVRRRPKRGRYDRAAVEAALDAGLVAHLAFVHDDQPYCIPTLYARAPATRSTSTGRRRAGCCARSPTARRPA